MGRDWNREVGRGACEKVGSWIVAQRGRPWDSSWGGRGAGIPTSCLLRSLKLECEKLASEKTEMQRHYVMVRGVWRVWGWGEWGGGLGCE